MICRYLHYELYKLSLKKIKAMVCIIRVIMFSWYSSRDTMYNDGGLSVMIITTSGNWNCQSFCFKFLQALYWPLNYWSEESFICQKVSYVFCQLFPWNPKENFNYVNNIRWQKSTSKECPCQFVCNVSILQKLFTSMTQSSLSYSIKQVLAEAMFNAINVLCVFGLYLH